VQDPIEECINNIANGSINDLEKLYIQTKPVVFGYALSILNNITDAEDVMQDTYVNVNRYASKYSKQNKPLAWILTITRNLAYNKIKKNNKVKELSDRELEKLSTQCSEYNTCLIKEIFNILTEEERKIIILNIVGGLKFREISKLLNIKLSTVLSKYNRALKKVSSKYKEEN
jgi:RNA polymerase sigma factor (sigma-70 family)